MHFYVDRQILFTNYNLNKNCQKYYKKVIEQSQLYKKKGAEQFQVAYYKHL